MNSLIPVSWKSSLDDLRGNISGIFDRWLPARMKSQDTDTQEFWPAAWTFSNGPLVDLEDTGDELRVSLEVPGISEKEIQVHLEGQRLVVRGEKKSSREEKKGNCYYSECSYGSFHRSIPLPCEVDAEKVNASYKHGVIRITLPKTEAAKARKIQVKVA